MWIAIDNNKKQYLIQGQNMNGLFICSIPWEVDDLNFYSNKRNIFWL